MQSCFLLERRVVNCTTPDPEPATWGELIARMKAPAGIFGEPRLDGNTISESGALARHVPSFSSSKHSSKPFTGPEFLLFDKVEILFRSRQIPLSRI
jgi:hypothetical protein